MTQQAAIDRVMNCPSLPSLPAVAMQVLELTRDPKISIAQISQTVQNDPALTTKVLRTVNSSYYALQTPCPNIGRAMSLLGLNTVKAIVLGFSLIDCTKQIGHSGHFDMTSYWRRAIYGAAAARALAIATRSCDPEEAFVGSLLQDIGMLASYTALRGEYVAVLEKAAEDHDELAAHERDALGFDHMSVGKMLGTKWRLPPQVVECIAQHHNAERAAGPHKGLVLTVALANTAAGALMPNASQKKLNAFVVGANRFFDMRLDAARALIETAAKGAKELAKSLEMNVGEPPDVAGILATANERMAEAQEEIQRETLELRRNNEELSRQTITDGLTGAFNRAHFDRQCREMYERCRASNLPMSVVFLDADKFKSVNDTHGHQAGDAVLMELARRLRVVGDRVGTFCRYGGEEFVLVAGAIDADKAKRLGELLRQTICKEEFDLSKYDLPGLSLKITISVGVATATPGTASWAWTPEQLTHAADEAVYAAKQAGRNCVRWSNGPSTERPAGPKSLLIVEDDPFTTRMIQKVLEGRKDLAPQFVRSLSEARLAMSAGKPLTDAVVIDMNLRDGLGTEVVRVVRAHAAGSRIPVAIMSEEKSESQRLQAAAAGADIFIDKLDLINDPSGQLKRLFDTAAAKAA